MFKEVYDTNSNGIVDKAELALEANHAASADNATNATHADSASNADNATTAETANYALVAKSIETSPDFNAVTEEQINYWNSKQNALGFNPENIANKGLPNGYVPLNDDSKIDSTFLYDPRWETIANRPTSSVIDIDDAVSKKHAHSNKVTLDRISENPDGMPIWNLQEWPYAGDMKKSIYDANDDGVVDRASTSDHVAWRNISNKPISEASDIDDAVNRKHSHNNLDSLDLLTKDDNNLPLWDNRTWPYDMSQSMYDRDKDGVIDEASYARSTKWDNITERPASTVEDIDSAVESKHVHDNINTLNVLNKNLTEDRLTFNGKEIAFKEDINATTPITIGDTVTARFSIDIDTDDNAIQLVNDKAFPEPNMYYGTDSNQNRGFHKLPDTKFTGVNSIKIDSLGRTSLENDNPMPDANMYYGTNSEGVRGYYNLPDITVTPAPLTSIDPELIVQDETHRFITDEQLNQISEIKEAIDNMGVSTYDDDAVTVSMTRQCAISLPPAFFVLDGSDLILKATPDRPAILSFSYGKNKEIVRELTNNLTLPNVPSIINAGIAYIFLFIDKDSKEIKVSKSPYKPIYSTSMPHELDIGRYWFNINNYTMYVSNGNTYLPAEEPTLFIGEVSSYNNKASVIIYACNGIYDSGWFNVNYSTTYNKNHNLGTDMVSITAYRGLDGVNLGEFAFAIHGGSTIMDNTPFGDRVSRITDMSVQTTRYNKMQYSDTIYAGSNQHRVIVKRLW